MPESAVPPRQAHALIPVRYASSRLPGKPLLPLKGRPMFYHVWRRARLCPGLSSVTLATDDERIRRAASELDVPVLMTSPAHASGTDRVHEAARLLKLPRKALIVNIQGDEPALDPGLVSLLLGAFADPAVEAATAAHPLDAADFARVDKVKVVLDRTGDALYFSRALIPCARDDGWAAPPLGHIGIYAFTFPTLEKFVGLPPSPLERTEKLEQLRLLENGIKMRVVLTDRASPGVDRAEDLEAVLPYVDDYSTV
ncbi:MAG: 3-deoxy-manno-octulosonate cytidylyltransferase [Desulfovibrio sp.]|jgi:3-deoxy-manno-octulosonate cytidylyltransferase (CMP-KDO synthetase)|nr:3-deoxy-manno-octulosonate cytidylyltransferase [Desulfovibrio sp.]